MKQYFILIFLIFSLLEGFSQCMDADISVTRSCVDGEGNITILTNDLDSVIYSIDGGATFVNTPAFPNLNIGFYNIVVKDSTGCELIFTEEIEEFLEVGPLVVTTSCAIPTGEIVIEGSKGLPFYRYSFDGGSSFYTDSNKNELGAGVYHVVIKDNYGCEVDTMVTVEAYPTISPTITTTNEQCNGIGPGVLDATFTDGANYSFSLDGGTTTTGTAYNNPSMLAGFYVLEVSDQYGCSSSFQVEIGADLVDDSVQINNELCHYGNADIEVFGFLGVEPYEYSIDDGTTYSPTGVFSELSQGNHVVLIKDATGCVKTDSIYVANFGGVNAIPSLEDTICLGNDAIVSVSHNAGVGADYEWSNGLGNMQSHTVSPSVNTVYSVIVTDGYDCKDTVETMVYVENFPVVSLSESQIQACIGDEIQLTAYGAARYVWSTGSTTDMVNYTAVGNETITVTGYNGQCSDQEQMVIIIKPSPTAVASSDATSINTGGTISFSNAGSVTSTTNWDFGDGDNAAMSHPTHQFDFAGAYMVVLTSSMGGCEATDSILVYVGTVSVGEITELNVLVYPNPAKEVVNIEVNEDSQLSLFSITGELISQERLNKGANQVYVDRFSKGVYFAKVKSSSKYYEFKLVVN